MDENIISRPEYMGRIAPFMGKDIIKVLSGMRRVGKSSLLRLLAKEYGQKEDAGPVVYLDMESLENEGLRAYRPFYDEVKRRLSGRKGLVLVDEVQEIVGWEKALASLLAENAADLVVTGSNASLFSGELATLLAGRAVPVEIWPLSLSEFDRFYRTPSASPEERFRLYLRYGGLPGLHQLDFNDTALMQFLDAIFSAIALKDIIGRHAIRNVDLFERTLRFAFDNVGNLLSCKRIVDFLKSEHRSASVETVANHLTALKDAFILHQVLRWDLKGKRHLQVAEKYYAGDVGIRHAVIGYKDGDIGGVLENLVYLELRRRGYKVSVGQLPDAEIDFVAERGGGTVYVQVAYQADTPETVERELSPLKSLRDRHPCRLLTMDQAQGRNFDGVERLYIPDFLRGQELA